MVLLQTAGGLELLVIALIFAILAGIVVTVVYLFRRLSTAVSTRQSRIQELEERLAELEEDVPR